MPGAASNDDSEKDKEGGAGQRFPILGAFVAATQWNWPKWRIGAIFGLLLVTDCGYVLGNMTKVPTGGWIPLTLGAILCLIFMTWRGGRLELRAALAKLAVPRSELSKLVAGVHRVPGTGVFLASNPHLVPSALIRNIEHNAVVHCNPATKSIEQIVTDKRLMWPDTLSWGSNDELYVTASQIENMPRFNHGKSAQTEPYKLWKIVGLPPMPR